MSLILLNNLNIYFVTQLLGWFLFKTIEEYEMFNFMEANKFLINYVILLDRLKFKRMFNSTINVCDSYLFYKDDDDALEESKCYQKDL